MKTLTILCVFLLCQAAPPKPKPKPTPLTPPTLADSFIASGTVVLYLEAEIFRGNFVISRLQDLEMGVESEMYPDPAQSKTDKALLRYDMNKTYYIRGAAKNPHCSSENRMFNGMPKFWEWLSGANNDFNTTIGKLNYTFWGTSVGGMEFELGVPQKKTKVLYIFNRKGVESSVSYSITHFEAIKKPNKTVKAMFDIPYFC